MHSRRSHQEVASGAQKLSKFFSLEDFETPQKKFFEGLSALQESPGGCFNGAQKLSKFFSLEDFETRQKNFFEGLSALQEPPGGVLLELKNFLSSFPLKTLKLARKTFLKASVHSRSHQEVCFWSSKTF